MVNKQNAGAGSREAPDLENLVPDESIVLESDSHEINLLSAQDFNRRMDSLLSSIDWRTHDVVYGAMQIANTIMTSSSFLASSTDEGYWAFERDFVNRLRIRKAKQRPLDMRTWIKDKRRQYAYGNNYRFGNYDQVRRVAESVSGETRILEFLLYACSIADAEKILQDVVESARRYDLRPRVGLARYAGDIVNMRQVATKNLRTSAPFQVVSV